MARPMKPLVRGGGYYPSNGWTPLVYAGGYTTANGGEEPAPPPIEKTITGNPIHILDALAKPAQALSVKLEPIQDLHGYDNPWPAGGGKNLYNADAIPNSSSGGITATVNNGVITLNGTATSNSYFTVSNTGLSVGTYKFSFNNAIANSDVRVSFRNSDGTYFADAGCDTVNKTLAISNDEPKLVIIYIRSGAVLTNYVIKPQLEVGTAATDFAPFANICPISGHTDADVVRTGVNVWDGVTESGYINVNTGEELSSESQRRSLFVSCKPSTNYVYVNTNAASGVRIVFYDGAKNYAGMFSNNNRNPQSFTTPQNAKYLRFYWGDTSGISINYPSTDHDYHAYTGTTYPIPLGQTVYGGTLDVTTGKLTVDMAMVDLGTLSWGTAANAATQVAAWTITSSLTNIIKGASTNTVIGNIVCTKYKADTANNVYRGADKSIAVVTNGQLAVYDTALAGFTSAQVIAAMSGVQLVYELATPIEVDLTPTEITTLLGTNNVWSDGTMTLVYLADGNASDTEALNILLGGRYVNNHGEDEPTDREALNIILGGNER